MAKKKQRQSSTSNKEGHDDVTESSRSSRRPSAWMDVEMNQSARVIMKDESMRRSQQADSFRKSRAAASQKVTRTTYETDDPELSEEEQKKRRCWLLALKILIALVALVLLILFIVFIVDVARRSKNKGDSADSSDLDELPFQCFGGQSLTTTSGQDQHVLVAATRASVSATQVNNVGYQCTFRNLWIPQRQPVNFPVESAYWGGPLLWTHSLDFEPFQSGSPVSFGAQVLAQEGRSADLQQEMTTNGTAGGVNDWVERPGQNTLRVSSTSEYFVHLPPVVANQRFPYLSMMAGMQPSPDWFAGFHSFKLMESGIVEGGRKWYDHIKIQMFPWDAGTDAGSTYTESNPLNPPRAAQRIQLQNAPPGGELQSPNGQSIPPVGELECFMVAVGDGGLVSDTDILPDCDFFNDPCCDDLSSDCGRTLPNGAVPEPTCDLQEVLYYQDYQG